MVYPFAISHCCFFLYALVNCQGHIEDGDDDRIYEEDRTITPTYVPKKWLFYIPRHIAMIWDRLAFGKCVTPHNFGSEMDNRPQLWF